MVFVDARALPVSFGVLPPCASCGSIELRSLPLHEGGTMLRCADCGEIREFPLAIPIGSATLSDMANTNRSAGTRKMTGKTKATAHRKPAARKTTTRTTRARST